MFCDTEMVTERLKVRVLVAEDTIDKLSEADLGPEDDADILREAVSERSRDKEMDIERGTETDLEADFV
jgi:hypothetical protein